MSVKLIATDMDGTFLDRKGNYDKSRFSAVLDRLQEKDVHFIIASGNHFCQLYERMQPFSDRLVFSAENGSYLFSRGNVLYSADLPMETLFRALSALKSFPDFLTIVSCENMAYMLDSSPEKFVEIMRYFYPRLALIPDYSEIPEKSFLRLAVSVPENKTMEYVRLLRENLEGILDATSSGHGCIDLIRPGLSKAVSLQMLMDRWKLKPEECMAFGDGYNDTEMLRLVKYGYVVENGAPELLAAFPLHAPSNNDSGVLAAIEDALDSGLI